jgi:hypothetical protein
VSFSNDLVVPPPVTIGEGSGRKLRSVGRLRGIESCHGRATRELRTEVAIEDNS